MKKKTKLLQRQQESKPIKGAGIGTTGAVLALVSPLFPPPKSLLISQPVYIPVVFTRSHF